MMPRGGNNRLPDEIKAANGTLKPSRTNPDKPRLASAPIPAAPERLDALERQIWARLKLVVDPLGVATVSDSEAFEMMVYARANLERLRTNPDAGQKEIQAALKAVKEWFVQFGITPQSRSTVKALAGDAVVEDEIDALFVN